MTLAKRLHRIETSLTPKQAVLLWLDEMLPLGLVGYAEKSFKRPMHEAPRARLTNMAGRAVRESLCKQGMKWELTAHSAREARIQTDSLIVLVKDLQGDVHLQCVLNAPYLVLLYEKFERMLEHFTEHDRFDAEMWELWRVFLIRRFVEMWRLREVVKAISNEYYDCHVLLFREEASRLDEHIQGLEKLMKHYNCLKGGLPRWKAFEFDDLTSSIRKQVPEQVAERVARAQSTTLEDIGEAEAAWKIVEPYAFAALKQLRDST